MSPIDELALVARDLADDAARAEQEDQQDATAYSAGYAAGLKMRPNYARQHTDRAYSQGYSDGLISYRAEFEQQCKPQLSEIPGERHAAGLAAAQMGDRPYWADAEYIAGWLSGLTLKPDGSILYGSGFMESCPSDRTRREWHHEEF